MLEVLAKSSDAQNEALLKFKADLKKRIFLNGLDATGSRIGSYSTKPMYVSVEKFKAKYGGTVKTGALKPRGKEKTKDLKIKGKKKIKKNEFQNGKLRMAMYLPDGYSQLRQLAGRFTDKVNLYFSGNLSESIAIGSTTNGTELAFLNQDQADIADGLETKYGGGTAKKTIFAASDIEIKEIDSIVESLMDKAFLSALDS